MAMNMNRAFNARMLSTIKRYQETEGYYNDDNDYVKGHLKTSIIKGVIYAGNKFAQFEEGIAVLATEGGERISDYRTLYVSNRYPRLDINDKLEFQDTYYKILQESDETTFGFWSYMLEKDNDWRPYAE